MADKVILKLQTAGFNLINFDDRERSEILTEACLKFTKKRYDAFSNVKQRGFEADSERRLELSALITSTKEFKRVRSGNNGDFMLGTADNGALRTPDKDYQGLSGGDYVETDFGVFVRIPDEALYIITESATTSKGNLTKPMVPVEVITYEEYMKNLHNSFKAPYYNKVWRLDWGSYETAGNDNDYSSSKFTGSVITGFTGINADGTGSNIIINSQRSAMLIPGKDWVIEGYRLHYVKRPRPIVVDTITPANQVNCELHESVHEEIVDVAVEYAVTNRLPDQTKYQVAAKENAENQ